MFANSAQVFEHPSAVSGQRVCMTTLQHSFRHGKESGRKTNTPSA